MSHLLSPLVETYSLTKGKKIPWNYKLEAVIKPINIMLSDETLMNYLDCKIPFAFHSGDSDKQLGAVISQNNKQIFFFLGILIKPQFNYTTK